MKIKFIDSQSPIKHIFLLFILAPVISYLYAIFKGKLNGDFLGVEVLIPNWLLLINLIFSLIPLTFVWKLFEFYKKKQIKKSHNIPIVFLGTFLTILIIWNIYITIYFGVGVMAAPPYEAPNNIKIVIQILNRFNYMYGVFLYIMVVPKKNKFQFILVILLMIASYLRAGLGVILYLTMIYYLKYFEEIKLFIKRYLLIVFGFLMLMPFLISNLYNIRSTLRKQSDQEISEDIILGVLIGRLSSFSDSAFILQEAPYFILSSQDLDNLYFQKQALGGVISVNLMPEIRPEKMLFKFYNENSNESISYMAGTQGNLYISLFKSINVFLLNLVNIIIYMVLTFKVFRMLKFNFSNELALILLLYVTMSGVSNEYAFLIFSIFVFISLFYMVNNLKKSIS